MQERNAALMLCCTYTSIICLYLCDGVAQSENSSDGQHTLYAGLAFQVTLRTHKEMSFNGNDKFTNTRTQNVLHGEKTNDICNRPAKDNSNTINNKRERILPKANPRIITLSSMASKKKRVISQSTWEHTKHEQWLIVQWTVCKCILKKIKTNNTGLVSVQCFCILSPPPAVTVQPWQRVEGPASSSVWAAWEWAQYSRNVNNAFPSRAWKPKKDKLQLLSAALSIK